MKKLLIKREEISSDLSLTDIIEDRKNRLTNYQDSKLAKKYEELVNKACNIDENKGISVAKCCYKLRTYKEE